MWINCCLKYKKPKFSPYTALFAVHRLYKEEKQYVSCPKMNTKISPRVTHQKLMDLFRYSLIDIMDLQEKSSFIHHCSIILLHHFQAFTTPFLLLFRNKKREIITTYVKCHTLSIPGNTGKIRGSVKVIRGHLVYVISFLVCTPLGFKKVSKIKGF